MTGPDIEVADLSPRSVLIAGTTGWRSACKPLTRKPTAWYFGGRAGRSRSATVNCNMAS